MPRPITPSSQDFDPGQTYSRSKVKPIVIKKKAVPKPILDPATFALPKIDLNTKIDYVPGTVLPTVPEIKSLPEPAPVYTPPTVPDRVRVDRFILPGATSPYKPYTPSVIYMTTDSKDGKIPNPELFGIEHTEQVNMDLKGVPSRQMEVYTKLLQSFYEGYLGNLSDEEAEKAMNALFTTEQRYNPETGTITPVRVMRMDAEVPEVYQAAWNYIAYIDMAKGYQQTEAYKKYQKREAAIVDYDDPNQINSVADVLRTSLFHSGYGTALVKAFTAHDVSSVFQLIAAGFTDKNSPFRLYGEYLKNVYWNPIQKKSAMGFGINILNDLGETADALASPLYATVLPYELIFDKDSRYYFQSSISEKAQDDLIQNYHIDTLLNPKTHSRYHRIRPEEDVIQQLKDAGLYEEYLTYKAEYEEHLASLKDTDFSRFIKGAINNDRVDPDSGNFATDMLFSLALDPMTILGGVSGGVKMGVKGAIKGVGRTTVDTLINTGILKTSEKYGSGIYKSEINRIIREMGKDIMRPTDEKVETIVEASVARLRKRGLINRTAEGASQEHIVADALKNFIKSEQLNKAFNVYKAAYYGGAFADTVDGAILKSVFAVPYYGYKGLKVGTKKMMFFKKTVINPIMKKYQKADNPGAVSLTHIYKVFDEISQAAPIISSQCDSISDMLNNKMSDDILGAFKIDAAQVTEGLSKIAKAAAKSTDEVAIRAQYNEFIFKITDGKYKTLEDYSTFLQRVNEDLDGQIPEFKDLQKKTDNAIASTTEVADRALIMVLDKTYETLQPLLKETLDLWKTIFKNTDAGKIVAKDMVEEAIRAYQMSKAVLDETLKELLTHLPELETYSNSEFLQALTQLFTETQTKSNPQNAVTPDFFDVKNVRAELMQRIEVQDTFLKQLKFLYNRPLLRPSLQKGTPDTKAVIQKASLGLAENLFKKGHLIKSLDDNSKFIKNLYKDQQSRSTRKVAKKLQTETENRIEYDIDNIQLKPLEHTVFNGATMNDVADFFATTYTNDLKKIEELIDFDFGVMDETVAATKAVREPRGRDKILRDLGLDKKLLELQRLPDTDITKKVEIGKIRKRVEHEYLLDKQAARTEYKGAPLVDRSQMLNSAEISEEYQNIMESLEQMKAIEHPEPAQMDVNLTVDYLVDARPRLNYGPTLPDLSINHALHPDVRLARYEELYAPIKDPISHMNLVASARKVQEVQTRTVKYTRTATASIPALKRIVEEVLTLRRNLFDMAERVPRTLEYLESSELYQTVMDLVDNNSEIREAIQEFDNLALNSESAYVRLKLLNIETMQRFYFDPKVEKVVQDFTTHVGPIYDRIAEYLTDVKLVTEEGQRNFEMAHELASKLKMMRGLYSLREKLTSLFKNDQTALDAIDILSGFYNSPAVYFNDVGSETMNTFINKFKLKQYSQTMVDKLSLDNFRIELENPNGEFWKAFPGQYEQCKPLIRKFTEAGHISPLKDVRVQMLMIYLRDANDSAGRAVYKMDNAQVQEYNHLVSQRKTVWISDIETASLNSNVSAITSIAYMKWVPLKKAEPTVKDVMEHCLRKDDAVERRVQYYYKDGKRPYASPGSVNAAFKGLERGQQYAEWDKAHIVMDKNLAYPEDKMLRDACIEMGIMGEGRKRKNTYLVHHNMDGFDAGYLSNRINFLFGDSANSNLGAEVIKNTYNSLEQMKPKEIRMTPEVEAEFRNLILDYAKIFPDNLQLPAYHQFLQDLQNLFPEVFHTELNGIDAGQQAVHPIKELVQNLTETNKDINTINRYWRHGLVEDVRTLKATSLSNASLKTIFSPTEYKKYLSTLRIKDPAMRELKLKEFDEIYQNAMIRPLLEETGAAKEAIDDFLATHPNFSAILNFGNTHMKVGYAKEFNPEIFKLYFNNLDLFAKTVTSDTLWYFKKVLRKLTNETDRYIRNITPVMPHYKNLQDGILAMKLNFQANGATPIEDIWATVYVPEDPATVYSLARILYDYYGDAGFAKLMLKEGLFTEEVAKSFVTLFKTDRILTDALTSQRNMHLIRPEQMISRDDLSLALTMCDNTGMQHRLAQMDDAIDIHDQVMAKSYAISAALVTNLKALQKYEKLSVDDRAIYMEVEKAAHLKRQKVHMKYMLDLFSTGGEYQIRERLISHLVYEDTLKISRKGLDLDAVQKIQKIVDAAKADSTLVVGSNENFYFIDLHKKGRYALQADEGMITLNGRPIQRLAYRTIGLDKAMFKGTITKDICRNISRQYGRNLAFERAGKEFDFSDIAEDLEKAQHEICRLSSGHANGSFGQAIKTDDMAAAYRLYPVDFQKSARTLEQKSVGIFWRTPRYDKSTIGVGEFRFGVYGKRAAAFQTQLISNHFALRAAAARAENEVLYVNMYFNKSEHLGIDAMFAGSTDGEILSVLRESPQYAVVSINPVKRKIKDPVSTNSGYIIEDGYEIYKHSISTVTDLNQARQLGAILVPTAVYETSFQELNKNEISGPFLSKWARIAHTYKVGFLFTTGTWIRNYVDSSIKMMLETGVGPIGAGRMQITAFKKREAYQRIFNEIHAMAPTRQIQMYNITQYYNRLSKENKAAAKRGEAIRDVGLTQAEFEVMHGIITASGNEADVLQKQFRKFEQEGKRAAQIKDEFGNKVVNPLHPARYFELEELRTYYNKIVDREGILSWNDLVALRQLPPSQMPRQRQSVRTAYKQTMDRILDKKIYAETPVSEKIGHAYNTVVDTALTPISFTEQIVRISHYLYMQEEGYTANQILSSISQTHFNYMMKSDLMRKVELVIPFAFFEKSNLEYWLRALDNNAVALSALEDFMGEASWDFSETDLEDLKYNSTLQSAMLNGSLQIDKMTGLTLKINPSAMAALTWMYNTPNAFIEKTITPLRQVMIDSLANYGGVMAGMFDPNLFWSANASEEFYKSILNVQNIPIIGAAYVRYAQMAPKYYQRLDAQGADVEKWIAALNASLIGALNVTPDVVKFESFDDFQQYLRSQGKVYDANKGYVVDIDELSNGGLNEFFFEGFNSDDKLYRQQLFEKLKDEMLLHKGKVWDANVQDFVDLAAYRPGGLNKNYDLENGDWPELQEDMKRILGKVWDANQRAFVKPEDMIPGMLNTPGISWDTVKLYRESIFNELWDANLGEFVAKEDYSGDWGLNSPNMTWNELVYFKLLLHNEVWDQNKQKFVPAGSDVPETDAMQKYQTGNFGGYDIRGLDKIPTVPVNNQRFAMHGQTLVAPVMKTNYSNYQQGAQVSYYPSQDNTRLWRMQAQTNSLIRRLRYARFTPIARIHMTSGLTTQQRVDQIRYQYRVWR